MFNPSAFERVLKQSVPSPELDYTGEQWVGGLIYCFVPEDSELFDGTTNRIIDDLEKALGRIIREIHYDGPDEPVKQSHQLSERLNTHKGDIVKHLADNIPPFEWLVISHRHADMLSSVDKTTLIRSTFLFSYVWNEKNPRLNACSVDNAKDELTAGLLGKRKPGQYNDAF